MAFPSVEDLYEKHIKPLSPLERLRLMELTAHDLAQIPVLKQATDDTGATGLAHFIGAAQGSFATPEEADAFIRRERDAWGS